MECTIDIQFRMATIRDTQCVLLLVNRWYGLVDYKFMRDSFYVLSQSFTNLIDTLL